jgi:hypothetical protein
MCSMGVPDPLDEEVLAYYARQREDERLIQNAEQLLERVRTEELLERFSRHHPMSSWMLGV